MGSGNSFTVKVKKCRIHLARRQGENTENYKYNKSKKNDSRLFTRYFLCVLRVSVRDVLVVFDQPRNEAIKKAERNLSAFQAYLKLPVLMEGNVHFYPAVFL